MSNTNVLQQSAETTICIDNKDKTNEKKDKNKKNKKKNKEKTKRRKTEKQNNTHTHTHTERQKKINNGEEQKKGQISPQSTLHPRCFFYGRLGKFGAEIFGVLVITSGWLLRKSLVL